MKLFYQFCQLKYFTALLDVYLLDFSFFLLSADKLRCLSMSSLSAILFIFLPAALKDQAWVVYLIN